MQLISSRSNGNTHDTTAFPSMCRPFNNGADTTTDSAWRRAQLFNSRRRTGSRLLHRVARENLRNRPVTRFSFSHPSAPKDTPHKFSLNSPNFSRLENWLNWGSSTVVQWNVHAGQQTPLIIFLCSPKILAAQFRLYF